MSTYRANTQIKLSSTEIQAWLDTLNKNRKLGKVLGIALEYIYNSPDRDSILGDLSKVTTDFESEYSSEYATQLNALNDKIDKVHTLALDLKALAIVGNRLELDRKVECVELSTYILNRQILKLSNILGVDTSEFKDLQSKTQDICNIVDLVIESYGGMLSSLKVGNVVPIDSINLDETKGGVDASSESKDVETSVHMDDVVEIDEDDFGLIDGF